MVLYSARDAGISVRATLIIGGSYEEDSELLRCWTNAVISGHSSRLIVAVVDSLYTAEAARADECKTNGRRWYTAMPFDSIDLCPIL